MKTNNSKIYEVTRTVVYRVENESPIFWADVVGIDPEEWEEQLPGFWWHWDSKTDVKEVK